jgi:hypothetical protein
LRYDAPGREAQLAVGQVEQAPLRLASTVSCTFMFSVCRLVRTASAQSSVQAALVNGLTPLVQRPVAPWKPPPGVPELPLYWNPRP